MSKEEIMVKKKRGRHSPKKSTDVIEIEEDLSGPDEADSLLKEEEIVMVRRSMRAREAPKKYHEELKQQMLLQQQQKSKRHQGKQKATEDAEDEEIEEEEEEEEEDVSEEEKPVRKSKKRTPTRRRRPVIDNDDDNISESAFDINSSDDSDEDSGVKRRKVQRVVKKPQFDPAYASQLATNYPDSYWTPYKDSKMIEFINNENPVTLQQTLTHQGSVYSLQLSPDMEVLASCSNLGSIKLWDISTCKQLIELRDEKEENIEEFFVMCWSDDGTHIVAGGKLKSRKKWDERDDDNHILPCPLKIFDVMSGKVVGKLEGHTEEVVCMKKIKFQGRNYIVTSSEDGHIIKWEMNNKFNKLVRMERLDDQTTNMAISLSFLPNCGNKYFLAACDDGIKLFDFEAGRVMESWPAVYSYLCDCIKFVECKEIEKQPGEHYLLSKGVELLNEDDSSEVMYPNKCILHKLTIPKTAKDPWLLEEVSRYEHDEYYSNLWLMHLTSNGRYVIGPTSVGKFFVWNLRTKELVAVVRRGEDTSEVRDILFHPTKPLLFACGDDSRIDIFAPGQPQPTEVLKQRNATEEENEVDVESFDSDSSSSTNGAKRGRKPKKSLVPNSQVIDLSKTKRK